MQAYKVEIELTQNQKIKVHQSIGICRFLYNNFISCNQENYKNGQPFASSKDFDKYVNHVLKKEFEWIDSCNAKSRKQALVNAEKAYNNFFKGKAKFPKFPKFKKKRDQQVKMYLPKNNDTDFVIHRHKAKVPSLGYIRLKEKNYVPVGAEISSCTISQKAGRYFASFLLKKGTEKTKEKPVLRKKGVGIDLGLKDFAITSDGDVFGNINKSRKVRRLEVSLRRAQRSLSRKLEARKKRKLSGVKKIIKNPKEQEEYGANIKKAVLRIQNLHRKLTNLRWSYVKEVIAKVVKTKPSYITIEDLNIKGMMKNKHLSKVVASQNFYRFRAWLEQACKKYGIELRVVGRFYPSSKLCSNCGEKKKKLSLSERTFKCECCKTELDRDLNASLNLEKATEYKVLVG